MNRLGILGVSAMTVMTATSAFAQDARSTPLRALQATAAPPDFSVGATSSGQQSPRTLFTIGGMDVHVSAPVMPPYNTDLGRDLATGPMLSAPPFWQPG